MPLPGISACPAAAKASLNGNPSLTQAATGGSVPAAVNTGTPPILTRTYGYPVMLALAAILVALITLRLRRNGWLSPTRLGPLQAGPARSIQRGLSKTQFEEIEPNRRMEGIEERV